MINKVGAFSDLSRSPAVVPLDDFLAMALDCLAQSPTKCVQITAGSVPTGALFIKALEAVALPTEIARAESRYGVTLKSLASQQRLKPCDILGFIAQIADCHETTAMLLKQGLEKSGPLARMVDKFESSAEVRKSLIARIGAIELSTAHTLFKQRRILHIDLSRLSLETKTMRLEQFHEILAKKLASGFLEEGMRIALPHLIDPLTGEVSEHSGCFVVKKVIKEKGLMAFALAPEGAPAFVRPTVLFRPTTQDIRHYNAFETFADDLCDHIGKRSFLAARAQLLALLANPDFLAKGQKADVCGFSLGGAHAARLLAAAPDAFAKAVFFNDPSTEETVAAQFASQLLLSSHTAESPLEIEIYHTDKDMVTQAGEMHVGYIPDTHAKARSLCRVSYHKLVTAQTEEDTAPTPTPRLYQLAWRVNRIQVASALKVKAKHHTAVVLSEGFDLQPVGRPVVAQLPPSLRRDITLKLPIEVDVSSLASPQASPKRSPLASSPHLRNVVALSPELLDRQSLPEVQRLNQFRLNTWFTRSVLFVFCRIAAFFAWLSIRLSSLVVVDRSDDKALSSRYTEIFNRAHLIGV